MSPIRRRVTGWTLATLLTLILVGLTIADHRSRDASIDDDVADLSASAAAAAELAVSQAVGRLEVTAVQLLAGEIDAATLDRATPIADAPLSAVIDVDAREILGISLNMAGADLDLDDVTLELALQAIPNLQRALEGTVTVAELLVGDSGGAGVLAVPFTADDGTRRVFATAFELADSSVATALASEVDGVAHELVDSNGRPVVQGATTTYDEDVAGRSATTPVDGTPWAVHTRAMTSFLAPGSTSAWNSMSLQLALVVVGMGGVTALWTRSVRQAEEVERSYERLARAGHHQREATAIVAHELRTPVTRVLGMTSLLTARRQQLDDDQLDQLLDRTHRSAEDLARLLEDLQVVVESSAAMAAEHTSVIRVTDLLRMVEPRVPEDASVDATGVPEDLAVRADGAMATRLLQAVVLNAATHGGGAVQIHAYADDDHVDIKVRDHGPGIPADFVEELFAPFTQGVGHLVRDRGGLGIGLAVARNLAAGMNGSITYEDARPGARFVIRLPGDRAPSVGA